MEGYGIRYERSYHLISRGVANRARRSYRGGGTARSGVPKMRFGRHRTRDLDVEPLRASVEPVVQYDISRLLLYCDCYYCDVSAATSAATATAATAAAAAAAAACYWQGATNYCYHCYYCYYSLPQRYCCLLSRKKRDTSQRPSMSRGYCTRRLSLGSQVPFSSSLCKGVRGGKGL